MIKCSFCNEEFEPTRDETWNEEMAKEEYHRLFPDSKWEDREVVCDYCWKSVGPKNPIYKKDFIQ